MISYISKTGFAIILFLIIIASCKTGTVATDSKPSIACTKIALNFEDHIRPIMLEYCATSGCHNRASRKDGYDFSNKESTVAAAKSGKLVCSIKWGKDCSRMPEMRPKLSPEIIKRIECWVAYNLDN